jgi:signal transduction histidine kinase/ActR/RegA family two-component response regulator
MVESELFGILLAARKEANSFSSGETEFLRMLSEQVALAAHQARLHAQLQKAYDELRQTQAAVMQQERLRALGQMASGIAHDINNALCPVVVYSDLLLQDTSSFNEATLRNLQTIKTAGEDIAHIVSRMREFYRQRDKSDTLMPVSLNKSAEQVADLTRPRWRDIPQARGIVIELEMELEPDLPAITGNESEVREALTNLILNSVDAMPQGGRLTIRTHTYGRDRSGGAAATHVMVEVTDTGTGMDEETRRRCLEPFFSTKGRRGTGLGLAMVYGIVERHDGSVEIDSTPGRGTTVRVVFPVRPAHHIDPAIPVETTIPLSALRILCIDDEPLLREMLKQILEAGGHTVEVADGGESGLELFREAVRREEQFNVVITDLGMPHLDGRQLSNIIKRESPETPVIMLTGWGTMMKEDGDVPAQVDGVLSKPPKISELFAMLGDVTNQKKAA